VTAEGAFTPDSDIDRIFGPVLHAQTYRQLLYSFIEFPLGIVYFVSMMAGVSVGFGTAILIIGLVILALTLALARGFAALERELAKSLLGAVFEDRPPLPTEFRAQFFAILRDRRAWSMVIYLILRLPLGIAGFVSGLFMVVAVPMIAAPLAYTVLPYWIADERIVTSEQAILVSLFGYAFFLGAAHLVNGVAAMSRKLAIALL
jgi:hypothetical protein